MISIKFGTVASTAPFKIRYDGETKQSEAIPKRLASYNPVLSDRVVILKIGIIYLCLGKVV